MAINLIDAVNSGKPVYIRSALGNSYLHVHGGKAYNEAPITLWEKVDQNNLKWFINTTDGGFYIQSAVNPNFVIHQLYANSDNGGAITLFDRTTHGHQNNMKVNFLSGDHGHYFIQFVHSKKFIHVNNAKTTNGNPVSQWEYIYQPNLLWDFHWA
jgi:hypothetical protein